MYVKYKSRLYLVHLIYFPTFNSTICPFRGGKNIKNNIDSNYI